MTAPASRKSSAADQHLPALDGVRGIAIMLVLVYHTLFQPNVTSLPDQLLSRAASVGWIGVDLFFVLSGFLITGILLDSKGRQGYFTNFYARRSLRIFPLYYLFLVIAIFVVPALTPDPALLDPRMQSTQWWHWAYAVNFLVAARGQLGPPADTGHFWSLAIEEQFYLLWPTVVYLCSRGSFKKVVIATIVGAWLLRVLLVARGADYWTVYVLTPTRADALAAGALLAILAREPGGLQRLAGWTKPLAYAATCLIVGDFFLRHRLYSGVADPLQLDGTFIALLGASVILGAVNAPPGSSAAGFFRSPVLRFFGRYSYCLYIVHFPLVHALDRYVLPRASFPRLGDVILPGTILFTILAVGLSVLIALASWYLFESPILRLKRFFPSGSANVVVERGSLAPRSASEA